jgi:hypothetical protein
VALVPVKCGVAMNALWNWLRLIALSFAHW